MGAREPHLLQASHMFPTYHADKDKNDIKSDELEVMLHIAKQKLL
jgi:hypothetical protein